MSFDVAPTLAAVFMLIFARVGTLVMLLPGVGERAIPARFRLSAALLMTLVLYPLVSRFYPETISGAPQLIGLLGGEVLVGGVLGITGRLLLSSLQTAGTVIAMQMGLGFVMQVDPTMQQQGALVGNFLTLVGLTFLFATDVHHLSIMALGDSYEIFRPGVLPDLGDSARYAVTVAAGAFRIGVQIAAPILIFGIIFNVGLGLLSRLMPQMQVFFIAVPAAILLGFALMAVTLPAMMTTFSDHVVQGMSELLMRR